MDPLLTKIGQGLLQSTAIAGLRGLRRELARRRGDEERSANLVSFDAELDEALRVLGASGEGIFDSAAAGLKALLVRPKVFDQTIARDWVASVGGHVSLKSLTLAAIAGTKEMAAVRQALANYQAFVDGDDKAPDAADVVEEALDFIVRSLRRDLTLGDRLLLQKIAGIAKQVDTLSPADTGAIVDAHVASNLERLRKTRFFVSSKPFAAADALGQALVEGNLRGASAQVRSEALAWCARLLAFVPNFDAQLYLDKAGTAAVKEHEPLLIARAFVRAREDWQGAVGLLDPDASSAQATAYLLIMRHALGTMDALDRLEKSGIGFERLDSDGRLIFLVSLLELARWDEAIAAIGQLEDSDHETTPALLGAAARTFVASTTPEDLRRHVLQDVPINPAGFPLGDNGAAIDVRRLAAQWMSRLAAMCDALGLPAEAVASRRYELWLDLRDSERHEGARARLTNYLREPGDKIGWLALALGFLPDIDRDEAELAIQESLIRRPKPLPDTAAAMTALLIDHAHREPVRAIEFLRSHRVALETFVEPQSLLQIEVRALADAGRSDEIKELVASHDSTIVPSDLRGHLTGTSGTAASIEALEAEYAKRPSTTTLLNLVGLYLELPPTDRFVELAGKLLADVPRASSAADIIQHLGAHGRNADALEMFERIGDAAVHSPNLIAAAARLAYNLGRFAYAEQLLGKVEEGRDSQQDRILRFQLLVATGRWEALDGFIEAQWRLRDERSPSELAQCASLAAQVRAKRTKDLALAAVAAAPDDPSILAGAYLALTTAGLETETEQAADWIIRAADLSGDEGPVWKGDIRTILDGAPKWESQVDEATKLLAAGTGPIDLIAAMLKRSWLDLHLGSLLANKADSDVRRQRLVPLFSGRRAPLRDVPIDYRILSIDAPALLTLAFVDVLEPALGCFNKVVVRHDLLSELFDQYNRQNFHQPSQIAFAHRLVDWITREKVRPFEISHIPDLGLIADIGQDRAEMLGEAAARDDGQHLYVHPFPISRIGTFLSEEAPVDRYKERIVSCSAVVDALKSMGRLTRKDAEAALAYLALHEQRWPNEPRIDKGATLYLSDLSVAHLRHVNVVDLIVAAGLKAVVSRTEVRDAHALLALEGLSSDVEAVLKRLRSVVTKGQDEGWLEFDSAPEGQSPDEPKVRATVNLVARGEAFVTDDRFFNRYEHFDHDGGRTPIMSSIELLSRLAAAGTFEDAKLRELRTALRAAGAAFVPVDRTDLKDQLQDTQIESNPDGSTPTLLETGELRTLRENARLIQARGWFDPLIDSVWLTELNQAAVDALVAQWQDDVPDDVAIARSNWLMGLNNVRDWADSQVKREMEGLAAFGSILDLTKIAACNQQVPDSRRAAFEQWLDADVLGPRLTREPALREPLLNHLRGLVRNVSAEMSADDPKADRMLVRHVIFNSLPAPLKAGMLDDPDFAQEVGASLGMSMEISDATFDRKEAFAAAKRLYAKPAGAQILRDADGRDWTLKVDEADGWSLLLNHDDLAYRIRGFLGLQSTSGKRLDLLDRFLREANVAPGALAEWRQRLAKAPIEPLELEQLDKALISFPPFAAQGIAESLADDGVKPSQLVPDAQSYYERLVGNCEAQLVTDFLKDSSLVRLDWFEGDPVERVHWLLLRASHPSVLAGMKADRLSTEQFHDLARWVEEQGDPLAKVAFIEMALPRAKVDPVLVRAILDIAKGIERLDPNDKLGTIYLLSSLTIFVDGQLSLQGTLGTWPPFRRRQAALAQASLISRILFGQINTASFSDYCTSQRGARFILQNLMDLRREPRWRPDLVAAVQLKNELIGRIYNAASAIDDQQLGPELRKFFRGGKKSFQKRHASPMIFWPGPLEGGTDSDLEVVAGDLRTAIEVGLKQRPLQAESLNALLNTHTILSLPSEIVEEASSAIKEAGPKLLASLEPAQADAYLLGIAAFAATQRRPDLADAVQVFARYQRNRQSDVPIEQELQLMLVACASREDIADWRDRIGRWSLELSDRMTDPEKAAIMLSWIDTMCEIDPLLRMRTGRARASLNLLLGQ